MSSMVASRIIRGISRHHALLQQPQVRTLFRGNYLEPSFRSLIRDMERTFNNVYHDIGRAFPLSIPRITSSGSAEAGDQPQTFRLNIDMSGFQPEDIKLSLKDRMLGINAKMDRKGYDGSRFYQEVTREYLLPETLKLDGLKSTFTDDGILCIEAPLTEGAKPREIPIESGDAPKKELQDK